MTITRIERIKNKMAQDYERYEELIDVRQDSIIKGKYTIIETDLNKEHGHRITVVDSASAAIIREYIF